MTIDDIYLKISQHIVDTIDAKWAVAIINSEIHVGAGHFNCVYKEDVSADVDYDFDSSFELFEAFENLHKITTEGGENNWNRAKFTLHPTGKFNVEFEWDQVLADEIESYSK
ncbi:MAG: hypothetical protein CMG75_08565 [Candidatus Marinimicrobia bacterium]|nr:hypothetical protein [Candidatus Neomarinimicrobiota bacterium]|tara:strand:- start:2624 stop:2959 length:336 start_codon:yes stop_codon:yes gene_type:complete